MADPVSQTAQPRPLCRLCLGDYPRLRVKPDMTGDMVCDACYPSVRPQDARDIIDRLHQDMRDWRGDEELRQDCIAEIERLRAIVRVNGLRWGHTHAEVDAILQEQRHG